MRTHLCVVEALRPVSRNARAAVSVTLNFDHLQASWSWGGRKGGMVVIDWSCKGRGSWMYWPARILMLLISHSLPPSRHCPFLFKAQLVHTHTLPLFLTPPPHPPCSLSQQQAKAKHTPRVRNQHTCMQARVRTLILILRPVTRRIHTHSHKALWWFTTFGEIFAYVTVFYSNCRVSHILFLWMQGVFVVSIHLSRAWTSGSLESMQYNTCVHRLDLG